MDWVVFGSQWLHILLGILWFGASLAIAAIIIPAISRLPILTQRETGGLIGQRATAVFDVVAPAVIVLGFVRGTFLGPIKGLDVVFWHHLRNHLARCADRCNPHLPVGKDSDQQSGPDHESRPT